MMLRFSMGFFVSHHALESDLVFIFGVLILFIDCFHSYVKGVGHGEHFGEKIA
jgi:hypothetical protein